MTPMPSKSPVRRAMRSAAALVATAALLSTTGLALGVAATSSGAAVPTYTWPVFHNSPALNGVSADPTITASNASNLGVDWMAPLGPSQGSPMIAYNTTLGLTLAYTGVAAGYLDAVNVANGQIVWSDYLGAAVISSPLVENGNVWIAPDSGGRFYKLNAATGAIECSAAATNTVLSTPVIATPPGGVTTVFLGSIGAGSKNGPVTAYAESDCAELWQWSSYIISGQMSGTWAPLSYAVDANGVGLLILGSANPDATVYALNAVTGALVWSYSTYCPAGEDWDVGAGTDISAPGVNGFADGMAYVEGKDGIFYALDLTTGALVWSYNFGGNSPTNPTATNTNALSTSALSGTTLVFGDLQGLYALNALNGTELWMLPGTGEIDSSPAIVGPAGSQVVAYGDLNGNFHVVSLSTGTSLYTYKTGNFITSSPADVDGNLIVASGDGFLYDFGLGGANGSEPTTAITSPTAGSNLANPNGPLTITGTASAADGVGGVSVQVQMNGTGGPWFDPSSDSFAPGLSTASATLSSPGATSTDWSLTMPVAAQSSSYQVLAEAVGEDGIADGTAFSSGSNAAAVRFSVQASSTVPVLTFSAPRVAPGSKFTIAATGFAAREKVTFTAPLPSGGTATLGSATANASGAVAATTVTLPSASAFGPDPITATGQTSGLVSVGSVYVSNNDPQFGYGPLHAGEELNDTVIHNHVGRPGKLAENWTVGGTGAFDTTPAIDNGIIYFGDEAGNFYAVTETTGQPVFTVAIGAPIESSPAVDGGTVFFGDDGGVVNALNAATGATVWSTTVGGSIGSVAVAGGAVYVGTSLGHLVSLSESSGAVNWTHAFGGSVTAAPAVDTTAGLAIVTNNHGLVEAISTASGNLAWRTSVGGAVTGAAVKAGIVYVGSSNGSVFALAESSGATDWSADAGSAITAPPVFGPSHVIIGTAAGDISYFDLTTGTLYNTQAQFKDPITGLTYADVLFITSTSGELGLIQGANYTPMNWTFHASKGFAAPAVLLNGDVFVLGEDGLLRAFTTPGRSIT
jgi:outer membrane protein assembly factor BamB